MLEERILLSADSLLGGLPQAAPDDVNPLFDSNPALPPLEEVLLSEGTCQQQSSSYASDSYDPAQNLEDIFSGLSEEDDSDDREEDSSEPSLYEDFSISSIQEENFTRGLQEFARVGRMLEDFGEFGTVFPLTEDSSMGGLLGLGEILDTRLSKPVFDYFNDAVDPPSTAGVLGALNRIQGDSGDLAIGLTSLKGGFAAADKEVRFDVKITATRKGEVRFDARAEMAGELSLEESATAAFEATLELDYTFGVDLDRSEEFYLSIREFEASLAIGIGASEADDTPDDPSGKGEGQEGVVEVDAQVSVQFDETIEEDGRITLTELEAITPETIDDFVSLAAVGTLVAELPASGGGSADEGPTFYIYIRSDDLFAEDSPEVTVKTDITLFKEPILEMLRELSQLSGSITDSEALNVNLPIIENSLNQLFSAEAEGRLGSVFDLYTPALEYFTLLEVFNFDLTDEVSLSKIGALPGISTPGFDLNNAAHRRNLKEVIESEYDLSLAQDWDINLYLPEIWSLVNKDFQINEYLPNFQLLLGLPYVPKLDEIRSDIKSYLGSIPSLKGLVDYIQTTRLKPLFNGFSGQFSSEPFHFGGEYLLESKEVRFDLHSDAVREVDLSVNLQNLFADQFSDLELSFDCALSLRLALGLNFDFSASVSSEDASLIMREASVTVQVSEEIDGLEVTAEDLSDSTRIVSEGRFDLDSRVELIFHGLDPPATEASGTLTIDLPVVSDNPNQPTFYIYLESNNVFDPFSLVLSVDLHTDEPAEIFDAVQDSPVDDEGYFIFMAGPRDNDFTLQLNAEDPTLFELFDNQTERVILSHSLADVTSLTITGSNQGDDSLKIHASLLSTVPITFNGGLGSDTLIGPDADSTWTVTGPNAGVVENVSFTTVENLVGGADNADTFVFEALGTISGVVQGGARGFDTIVLAAGYFFNVTYTGTSVDSGTIRRDDDLITYEGFEPMVDMTGGPARVINTTGGADVITLRDSGAAADNTFMVEISTMEDVIFNDANIITSLTINTLDEDDTILLEALDGNFNGNLLIDAGLGDDEITINAVTGGGTYTLDGGVSSIFTSTTTSP